MLSGQDGITSVTPEIKTMLTRDRIRHDGQQTVWGYFCIRLFNFRTQRPLWPKLEPAKCNSYNTFDRRVIAQGQQLAFVKRPKMLELLFACLIESSFMIVVLGHSTEQNRGSQLNAHLHL